MAKSVYKSEEGKKIVEKFYSRVIEQYSPAEYEALFIPTEIGVTHVLRFGDRRKKTLIMIHGSASNSAVWLGAIPEFIDKFCVYCMDIPGEPGLSEAKRTPLGSNDNAIWLKTIMDSLGIAETSFLTVSLGSWYAINFTIRFPEKVKSISLLTTPGIVTAKKSFILKAIFYMMLGDIGQKLLSNAIYHKTEVPLIAREFQALVSKHFVPLTAPIPIFNDELIRNIKAPVQYFGGDHDVLLNSKETGARLKKLIPGAEINILKDTGHVIIDQFNNVKRFLVQK